MALTQSEINEIAKKSEIISNLNVVDFLKMIKDKVAKWKGQMNGN